MPTDDEHKSLYRSHYYQTSIGRAGSWAKGWIKHLFRVFRTANQTMFIMQVLSPPKALRILEVGAGDGRLLSRLKSLAGERHDNLHGLELSPYYNAYALRKWGLKLRDDNFFSLTESYDLIVMSHVFEHFIDLTQVMEQMDRVLRPGGYAFVEVPHSPSPSEVSPEALKRFLNTTHTYNFTAASIRDYWQRSGYQVLAAERTVYRLPRGLSSEARTKVAQVFLEGTGLGWRTAWYAVWYILRHATNPEKAYTTIPWDAPYWGPGDSVRLLLRRRSVVGS